MRSSELPSVWGIGNYAARFLIYSFGYPIAPSGICGYGTPTTYFDDLLSAGLGD
jgi:hypothetical protein